METLHFFPEAVHEHHNKPKWTIQATHTAQTSTTCLFVTPPHKPFDTNHCRVSSPCHLMFVTSGVSWSFGRMQDIPGNDDSLIILGSRPRIQTLFMEKQSSLSPRLDAERRLPCTCQSYMALDGSLSFPKHTRKLVVCTLLPLKGGCSTSCRANAGLCSANFRSVLREAIKYVMAVLGCIDFGILVKMETAKKLPTTTVQKKLTNAVRGYYHVKGTCTRASYLDG